MTSLQISGVLALTANSAQATSKDQCNAHHNSKAAGQIMTHATQVPMSAAEALSACAERACSPISGSMERSTAIGFMKDTADILQHGRSVVILALNDMSKLLTVSQKQADPVKAVSRGTCQEQSSWVHSIKGPSLLKKEVRACLRKMHFLLAWANEVPTGTYESLTAAVLFEWQQHAGMLTNRDHLALDFSIGPHIEAAPTNTNITGGAHLERYHSTS